MKLDITLSNLRKFCFLFFTTTLVAGIVLYTIYRKDLIGGIGFSAAIMSSVSLLHFVFKQSKNQQKLTFGISTFLMLACIGGIAMIFIVKSQNGSDFLLGTGAGVALVSGIAYVLELLFDFLDGIR